MINFKIRRGLYKDLFNTDTGAPRGIVEEGCWYLCTDTAELFLGASDNKLKRINGESSQGNLPEDSTVSIIKAEINSAGELIIQYSNGTSSTLGHVVGTDGKDGLVTTLIIGDDTYVHEDGTITLPDFATKDFVNEKFASVPENDLSEYAKKSDIPDVSHFISEIPAEFITESELDEKGFLTEHQDLGEYAKKTDIPSIEGFVTETYVKNAIAEAELNDKDVDLTGYATKDDIKNFITEVPSEYVTEAELTKVFNTLVLNGGSANGH